MEAQQRRDVDVAHAVAVRQEEALIAGVLLDAGDPSTGHCRSARARQRDAPVVLAMWSMDVDVATA